MSNDYPSDIESLRAEIAAAAARMIAEDGADYATAKRKAARQILGNVKVRGNILPDNEQIEGEVRIYNDLFLADSQPARLLQLRTLALGLMKEFNEFQPLITGAVVNGTATEHSDIHLQLFCDNPKDVLVHLINRNISFEVSETAHFRKSGESVETLSFMRNNEGVHLALYESNDLRGAVKPASSGRVERLNATGLKALINESRGDTQ